MKKMLLFIVISLLLTAQVLSQSTDKKKYLLTPAEILKIMESSKINYLIEEFNDENKTEDVMLSNQFYITTENDKTYLMQYKLSEKGNEAFHQAEEAYKNKDYDKAIALYRKILDTDKDYYQAYTMIGDMYYMKKMYDSAKSFFNQAIEKNFIDYQAHWFLADTYYKTDEIEKAVSEITTAHLLNRNHKKVLEKLKDYRDEADDDWEDWEVAPKCTTFQNGKNVVVQITKEWTGYAMAEALWKFEPGFAEGITGKKYDGYNGIYEKEAGCMAANLNSNTNTTINDIIKDGYFQEMIWYELVSKKVPSAVLLLPKNFFSRLTEYINKYH